MKADRCVEQSHIINYIFRDVRLWQFSGVTAAASSVQSESTDLKKNYCSITWSARCVWSIWGPLSYCTQMDVISVISAGRKCTTVGHEKSSSLTPGTSVQRIWLAKWNTPASTECTEIFNHDTTVGHQVICLCIPRICPIFKLEIGKYSWTGSYKDIKEHLKGNHLDNCCEYAESGNKLLCESSTVKYDFNFIFADNDIFFSLLLEEDDIHFMLFFCMLVLLQMQLNINTEWSSLIKMIRKVLQ